MKAYSSLGAITIIFSLHTSAAFQLNVPDTFSLQKQRTLYTTTDNRISSSLLSSPRDDGDKEYRNAATQILSNFLPKKKPEEESIDPLANIDFSAPKAKKINLETLAATLDAELYEKEWFVTGQVNPTLFSDDFKFQDPDVKLNGIEEYARGVYKLFDQETSRAEIISTIVNTTVPNTITVEWRLSGKVNIGPKLPIKPYIVYTDFTVNPNTGLVEFQEDRFVLPGWDILLSALFPFLIGTITAPPAPPVEPRVVLKPKSKSPLEDVFSNLFGN